VICGETENLSVHHIIERRLFENGGYFIQNGATLCGPCHIAAETTELSCFDIRAAAKIDFILLPEDYYPDHEYTKWGDVVMPNGTRMKGPLFDDESVQKVLAMGPNLNLYTHYVKYGRTYHLPFSEGVSKDDRVLKDCKNFEGKEVVVTTKLDGENSNLYRDYFHARSIDGRNHWSRSWVKNLHAKISYEIPDKWRLVGENLFAKHSIKYTDLESFFYLFSVWNDRNICLSWDETCEYASLLGLVTAPVLYRGVWDEKLIKGLYDDSKRDFMEGYVVRVASEFHYRDFSTSIAKRVRKNHVNPDSHHWFSSAIEKNELRIK
jgi:hypothetical protein